MIVIANKPGQLGNRLIVFAHIIAYAKEHQLRVLNPSFFEYRKYFTNTAGSGVPQYPSKSNPFGMFLGRLFYSFSFYLGRILHRLRVPNNRWLGYTYLDWHQELNLDESLSLTKSKLFIIQGWEFRARYLLNKYQQQVKDFFRPVSAHQEAVESHIKRLRKSCDLLVGVHIRGGDYNNFEGGKYYYQLGQYKRVMDHVLTLMTGKKVKFMICSNEEVNLDFYKDQELELGPGESVEDLYALAGCDYIIGPPSTFTMWASFYGNTPLYKIEDPDKHYDLNDFEVSIL